MELPKLNSKYQYSSMLQLCLALPSSAQLYWLAGFLWDCMSGGRLDRTGEPALDRHLTVATYFTTVSRGEETIGCQLCNWTL